MNMKQYIMFSTNVLCFVNKSTLTVTKGDFLLLFTDLICRGIKLLTRGFHLFSIDYRVLISTKLVVPIPLIIPTFLVLWVYSFLRVILCSYNIFDLKQITAYVCPR